MKVTAEFEFKIAKAQKNLKNVNDKLKELAKAGDYSSESYKRLIVQKIK